MYTMSCTYQTISPESAEQGDSCDNGFEYEDREFDTLEEIANTITQSGQTEFSCYPPRPNKGEWFTTSDPDTDYSNAHETYYSFHPVINSTDDWNTLFRLLGNTLYGNPFTKGNTHV